MKKIVLILAVLVSLFSCKNGSSIAGKWHVVDVKIDDTSMTKMMGPEQMKAMKDQIVKSNMTFDFGSDGNCNISMAERPTPTKTKYTVKDNNLTMTDSSGTSTIWQLVNMSDKGVTLKSVKEQMSFVLEKI